MNSPKGVLAATFSILLALAFACSLPLKADEFDEAMKLTFSQPVAIPGQVLQPGTYWFVRPAHGYEANVLQVFDSDRKNVVATLNTGTEQIVKPSGHITITMADRSPKPEALLSLTYPGREEGHMFEISYSGQERKQISEFPKITMKVSEKGEIQREESNSGM